MQKQYYSLLYFFYNYITETLYFNSYRVKNHKYKNLVKEVGIWVIIYIYLLQFGVFQGWLLSYKYFDLYMQYYIRDFQCILG